MTPHESSVSALLARLKEGDQQAIQRLWERYFTQLVEHARFHLRAAPRRIADEEDVALSAFDNLCRGAQDGRFPQLLDRDDLWQVLVMLTERSATDLVRRERRQKRGGGKVVAAIDLEGADGEVAAFAELIASEPEPAFAAEVAENCHRLLDSLNEPVLRQIAESKMQGRTTDEIASVLGVSGSTVERKLQRIRVIWSGQLTVG